MTQRFFSLLFLSLLLALGAFAQTPIRYHVSLDNIHQHELYIKIDFTELGTAPLVVRMPNASPGRYAEHSFAKNVYEVKAHDASGAPLQVVRTKPSEWEVRQHAGYVTFTYTLFGNHADGTYTGIDSRKLHLNMPATFAYGVSMDEHPIELTFDLSPVGDWKVATQLQPIDATTYAAPNYAYFFDSPVLVGKIDFRSWKSPSNGTDATIELAMMHEGTDAELDKYAEWIKRVVEAQKGVFGELPAFDYGRYTFLCSYNPWVRGDGMEHRNSTVCTSSRSLAQADTALIGTVSHEFFHAWNVERLRPASLEPFDFDRANMSDALWFAEGFTSYYADLILARAGILSPSKFINEQEGTFNYVLNSPGRALRTPIQMSQTAPFVDAAAFGDETNFANTYVSYYPYGAVLGYALDLSLRSTFKNITLDDYMRYLWQHFGKPEKPYEISDLQQALATVTGNEAFAKDFFSKYIYDSKLPDFPALFAKFGVEMKPRNPTAVGFGAASFRYGAEGPLVQNQVLRGSALYEAGATKGDRILTIDGKAFKNEAEFKAIVQQLKVGERYAISYVQQGYEKQGTFTAVADPSWSLTYLPDAKVDKKVRALRDSWIKGTGAKL
jgi:predicted metalloprotease with PDZ domain